MSVFKIGEKDRTGRQKRIEHTGEYLRASRTGGVALRAQGRVGAVNVTGNTSRGVRVSTQLAKNTQVAFQNGRFVLRGRYGSDAAKLNLSKSGISVSTKTPIGAVNWIRPGRSSAKVAGIQVRGQKALYVQAIYGVFTLLVAMVRLALALATALVQLLAWPVGALIERAQRAAAERERLDIAPSAVASEGERILAEQGIEPDRETRRDLFAALLFCVVALGRGRSRFDAAAAGLGQPRTAAGYALASDVETVGEQVANWLTDAPSKVAPEEPLGTLHALAGAFAARVDEATRAETLLSIDDACLAAGPRTRLQEAMLDVLADSLEVEWAPQGG